MGTAYTVTGAVMWYDASQESGVADGTLMSTLTDRSGSGNNATQTGAERAELKTAVINGKDVYRFNTGQAYPLPNVLSGFTSGEVFVAVKLDADPPATDAATGLWQLGTTGDSTHFPYTDGVIYEGFGTDVRKTVGNPAASLTSVRIYNVTAAAGSWTANLDGTQLFTTATNNFGFPTAPILGQGTGTFLLDGDLGEFVIFDHALTSGERATVLSGMQTKWQGAGGGTAHTRTVQRVLSTHTG